MGRGTHVTVSSLEAGARELRTSELIVISMFKRVSKIMSFGNGCEEDRRCASSKQSKEEDPYMNPSPRARPNSLLKPKRKASIYPALS
jgi:hypothetical protein